MLAAGLWFGRRWALIVAALAGAVIAVDAVLSDDGDLWVAAAQLALLGLTAWLVSALAERARRADAELQRIRPLQDVLAPRRPPSLPLLELASRYIPAQAGVSGDFYQVAEARNGAAVLVIGDVVGKGLTASRRSIFVRAMVTACAPYLDDPAAILRTVNTELVHQHGASAQFITMLCVVVKPDMTLTWASAAIRRRSLWPTGSRSGICRRAIRSASRPRSPSSRSATPRSPPAASCSTPTG